MFKPEWHRDGRNHWSRLDSSGSPLSSGKPPFNLWKEKGLRFPPGYKEVWVDLKHKKTPVRFLDQEDRVQYQYWPEALKRNRRAHWSRLHDIGPSFYGKLMPALKKTYPEDNWTVNDVIRLMINCSLECGIRPGYPKYRDEHQSFGISTLEMRHVRAKPGWTNPSVVILRFPGKKQVLNECETCTKKSQWKNALLRYMKWRRAQGHIGSHDLFWINPETKNIVHPSLLNEWIQTHIHPDAKMKDLRTWLVHRHVLDEMSKMKEIPETEKERKTVWKNMIINVAEQTHHTPAICQSSYLHPELKKCWLEKREPFHKAPMKLNEKKVLLGLWKK